MELTDKHIRQARMMADFAHQGQIYDKVFPYMMHVDAVVDVLREFDHGSRPMVIGGYFHDAIEDGNLSYGDIKKRFGKRVAEMVYCVTDELGRSRKERKAKTLPKTASNRDAIVLKLADRIANVRHGGLVRMYQEEHKEFKDALHIPGHADEMWEALEELLK